MIEDFAPEERNLTYEVYSYENGIATIRARCQRMYDATAVLNQQIDGGFIFDENGQEVARTGTPPTPVEGTEIPVPVVEEIVEEDYSGEH